VILLAAKRPRRTQLIGRLQQQSFTFVMLGQGRLSERRRSLAVQALGGCKSESVFMAMASIAAHLF